MEGILDMYMPKIFEADISSSFQVIVD